MKKIFSIGFIIIVIFFNSGCALLLVGAVGVGGYKATKAIFKRRPELTEMQRRALECKEIEGTREDVLRATVTVFQDRGFSIKSSDYTGGIITAEVEKPFLHILASVEEFTADRIKMRITMKDVDGVIEDEKVFAKMFDDIQAEVFRRINLNK